MKQRAVSLALLLLVAAAAVSVHASRTLQQGGGNAPALPRGGAKYREGRVLVIFEAGADQDAAYRAVKRAGRQAKRRDRLARRHDGGEVVAADLPAGLGVDEAVAAFRRQRGVVRAEPDFVVYKFASPNDPDLLSGALWGMSGAFGINGPAAWDLQSNCSEVYVGVVDEGIQYTHPDLADNVWTNPGEVAGDGLDNDGDGYVDDVHGYDFVNNRGDVYSAADGDDHGTHVSGTIGGVGNNAIGVAGVCWSVKLISAKFLGADGGYTSDAIRALDYLTMLKTKKGLNIVASSNSWGCGPSCYSQSLLDAIQRGYAAGILFIAAAGNEATSSVSYPAGYSVAANNAGAGVVAVAALTSSGGLASYSNRGSWVHLGAPGSSIKSTVPPDSYATYSGTSMATPHVTGAAALYKARWPQATAADVKNAILQSVTATSSLGSGKTSTGGRLNIAAMLAVVPPGSATCTSCTANQWCNAGICAPCASNCATCSSSSTCTSCATGWTGPGCTTPTCTTPCGAGKRCVVSGSAASCQDCPGNCGSCTDAGACLSCKAGWKGANCVQADCPDGCADGTYCAEGANGGECVACGPNCATCADASGCTSCASGWVGPPACTTPTCDPACAADTEYCLVTGGTAACTACPSNCATCSATGACTSCANGWTGPGCNTPTCYPQCAADTKYCLVSGGTATCTACPSNCATCSSTGACLTCANGWTGPGCNTPTCYPACIDGKHCVVSGNTASCQDCPGNCATCTDAGACLSCKAGWQGGACTEPSCPDGCADGTYCAAGANGGECVACTGNCATCSSATTCTSCANGWTGPPACNTPTCYPQCAADTEYCLVSGNTATCTTCPSNCATCSATGACLTCANGWTGPGCTTPTCYPECAAGTEVCVVSASTATCQACPAKCATCTSTGACLTCANGWEGPGCNRPTCYPACGDGAYCARTLASAQCVACAAKCATCSSSNTCLTCAPGYAGSRCNQRYCFPSCGAGQWCRVTGNAATCNACPAKCATCLDGNTCLTCAPQRAGPNCNSWTCAAPCPAGQYCRSTSSGASCAACGANCAACLAANLCTACQPGWRLPGCTSRCSLAGASVTSCGTCCSGRCRVGTKVCA